MWRSQDHAPQDSRLLAKNFAAIPGFVHDEPGDLSFYGFRLSDADDFCHFFMTKFQAPAVKENTNCR